MFIFAHTRPLMSSAMPNQVYLGFSILEKVRKYNNLMENTGVVQKIKLIEECCQLQRGDQFGLTCVSKHGWPNEIKRNKETVYASKCFKE